MSESIKVFAIKDPQGNFWRTPKGKSSWSSTGAAKLSWGCHNYKKHFYTTTKGNEHWYWVQKRWSEDAEGWSIVQLKEYRLVDEIPNE